MVKLRKPFVLGTVIVVGGILFCFLLVMRAPLSISTRTDVFVAKGATMTTAIDSIHRRCVLPTPRIMRFVASAVARLTSRHLQSGWYTFTEGATQWDVLVSLFSKRTRPTIRVTIPEGFRLAEIAQLLQRKIECDSAAFMNSANADAGPSSESLEGYLKPDTYDFFWRDSEDDIVDRLSDAFDAQWKQKCEPMMDSSALSKHDVIILASIVQAEAVVDDEMPRIAGVYLNRLRKAMPLAADPTVQYGLGDRTRVLLTDLHTNTPYNTYMHAGLPPGPINCPGLPALLAAIRPERHSYLFFVARGDGSGRHYFSSTAAQHVARVNQYRHARRKAAGR